MSTELEDVARAVKLSLQMQEKPAAEPDHGAKDDVPVDEASSSAVKATQVTLEELGGKFEVLYRVSQGTFSEVWIAGLSRDPSRLIALKRIYTTSGPVRVANEIRALQLLQGKCFVSPLFAGYRSACFNTLAMPYLEHDTFKSYFADLSVYETQLYIRTLLTALDHVHSHNIIHRDVKPSNFLFNRRLRQFMLVDFGLCQHCKPAMATRTASQAARKKKLVPPTAPSTTSVSGKKRARPRQATLDKRPIPAASRAGTRGFRAPEVLLRVRHQTTAIDVWSVGSILLSILTRRFPLFWSPDDLTAIAELNMVYGSARLLRAAAAMNRGLCLPQDIEPIPWRQYCKEMAGDGDLRQWSDDVFELLDRLLEPIPERRITARDALSHPFLAEMENVRPP